MCTTSLAGVGLLLFLFFGFLKVDFGPENKTKKTHGKKNLMYFIDTCKKTNETFFYNIR